MKKVFIHVGLHRTGTTFLQQHVFPQFPAKFFHMDAVNIRYKTLLAEGINILSSEYFSGSPLNFEDPNYCADDRYEIADLMKKLYPDAEIILVLRGRDDWKRSLYNQYTKSQGFITREQFDKQFDDDYLKFDVYIKYLEELFTIFKVHVLAYEELKENHQRFVNRICDIIGIPRMQVKNVIYNKSLTKGQERYLEIIRNINNFMIKKLRFGMERLNR